MLSRPTAIRNNGKSGIFLKICLLGVLSFFLSAHIAQAADTGVWTGPTPWTNDEDSGIVNGGAYTHAFNFANGNDTTINGLKFAGLPNVNGGGDAALAPIASEYQFKIDRGSAFHGWGMDQYGSIAGRYDDDSTNAAARELLTGNIYGNPDYILRGLIPGLEYETVFYSFHHQDNRGSAFSINGETPVNFYQHLPGYDQMTITWQGKADENGLITARLSHFQGDTWHMAGISNRFVPEANENVLMATGFAGLNGENIGPGKIISGTKMDHINRINPDAVWTTFGMNDVHPYVAPEGWAAGAANCGLGMEFAANTTGFDIRNILDGKITISADICLGTLQTEGGSAGYANVRGVGLGFYSLSSPSYDGAYGASDRGFSGLVIAPDGEIFFRSNIEPPMGTGEGYYSPAVSYNGTFDPGKFYHIDIDITIDPSGTFAILDRIIFDGSSENYYADLYGEKFETLDFIGFLTTSANNWAYRGYLDNFVVYGSLETASETPEPATWCLMFLAAGFLAVTAVRRKTRKICVLAMLFCVFCLPAEAQTNYVKNGDFGDILVGWDGNGYLRSWKSPVLPSGTPYTDIFADWTYTPLYYGNPDDYGDNDDTGIGVNGRIVGTYVFSGNTANMPETNLVFLQRHGTFSQEITGLTVGDTYYLTYQYNARSGYSAQIETWLGVMDGSGLKCQPMKAVGYQAGAYYDFIYEFTATDPEMMLTFRPDHSRGDQTLLLTNVSIVSGSDYTGTWGWVGLKPWTSDETSGIVPGGAYTHAFSFSNAESATINGLTFIGIPGNDVTNLHNSNPEYQFHTVRGGAYNDFAWQGYYDEGANKELLHGNLNGNPTYILSGLIPGMEYETVFYAASLESSGARNSCFTAHNGETQTFIQHVPDAGALTLTWQGKANANGVISMELTFSNNDHTWHTAAISNRLITEVTAPDGGAGQILLATGFGIGIKEGDAITGTKMDHVNVFGTDNPWVFRGNLENNEVRLHAPILENGGVRTSGNSGLATAFDLDTIKNLGYSTINISADICLAEMTGDTGGTGIGLGFFDAAYNTENKNWSACGFSGIAVTPEGKLYLYANPADNVIGSPDGVFETTPPSTDPNTVVPDGDMRSTLLGPSFADAGLSKSDWYHLSFDLLLDYDAGTGTLVGIRFGDYSSDDEYQSLIGSVFKNFDLVGFFSGGSSWAHGYLDNFIITGYGTLEDPSDATTPEPAAWCLMLLAAGFLAVTAVRRKTRKICVLAMLFCVFCLPMAQAEWIGLKPMNGPEDVVPGTYTYAYNFNNEGRNVEINGLMFTSYSGLGPDNPYRFGTSGGEVHGDFGWDLVSNDADWKWLLRGNIYNDPTYSLGGLIPGLKYETILYSICGWAGDERSSCFTDHNGESEVFFQGVTGPEGSAQMLVWQGTPKAEGTNGVISLALSRDGTPTGHSSHLAGISNRLITENLTGADSRPMEILLATGFGLGMSNNQELGGTRMDHINVFGAENTWRELNAFDKRIDNGRARLGANSGIVTTFDISQLDLYDKLTFSADVMPGSLRFNDTNAFGSWNEYDFLNGRGVGLGFYNGDIVSGNVSYGYYGLILMPDGTLYFRSNTEYIESGNRDIGGGVLSTGGEKFGTELEDFIKIAFLGEWDPNVMRSLSFDLERRDDDWVLTSIFLEGSGADYSPLINAGVTFDFSILDLVGFLSSGNGGDQISYVDNFVITGYGPLDNTAETPEPAAWCLMLLGGIFAVGVKFRKRIACLAMILLVSSASVSTAAVPENVFHVPNPYFSSYQPNSPLFGQYGYLETDPPSGVPYNEFTANAWIGGWTYVLNANLGGFGINGKDGRVTFSGDTNLPAENIAFFQYDSTFSTTVNDLIVGEKYVLTYRYNPRRDGTDQTATIRTEIGSLNITDHNTRNSNQGYYFKNIEFTADSPTMDLTFYFNEGATTLATDYAMNLANVAVFQVYDNHGGWGKVESWTDDASSKIVAGGTYTHALNFYGDKDWGENRPTVQNISMNGVEFLGVASPGMDFSQPAVRKTAERTGLYKLEFNWSLYDPGHAEQYADGSATKEILRNFIYDNPIVTLEGLIPGLEYETVILASTYGAGARRSWITVNGQDGAVFDTGTGKESVDNSLAGYEGRTLTWRGKPSADGKLTFHFEQIHNDGWHLYGIANRFLPGENLILATGFGGLNGENNGKNPAGTTMDHYNAFGADNPWREMSGGWTLDVTNGQARLGANTGISTDFDISKLSAYEKITLSADVRPGDLEMGDNAYAIGRGVGMGFYEYPSIGKVSCGFYGLILAPDGTLYFYSNHSQSAEDGGQLLTAGGTFTSNQAEYLTIPFVGIDGEEFKPTEKMYRLSFDIELLDGDWTLTGISLDGSAADYSQLADVGVTFDFSTLDLVGFLSSSAAAGRHSYVDNFVMTGYGPLDDTSGVPEPATWCLMLLAGGWLVLRRNRNKK